MYDIVTWGAEVTVLPSHRAYLASGLSGRVLDLGIGTGAMIPYIAAVAQTTPSFEYHGIEPDPSMRRRAARKANRHDVSVTITPGIAEALPYADDQFDAVISAVTFCTVFDPEAALDDVTRVLRPGGEFRFLEHVQGAGWRGRFQDIVAPAWSRLAGGCRVTRPSVSWFRSRTELEEIETSRVPIGVPPVAPFYRGRFKRR